MPSAFAQAGKSTGHVARAPTLARSRKGNRMLPNAGDPERRLPTGRAALDVSPMNVVPAEFARFIDHTLLRPDATAADVERLCSEAARHRFHAVCVHGSRVALASARLEDAGAGVLVASVVGFPMGASDTDSKRFEVESVIDHGAQEVDVVMNVGRLKDGDDRGLLRELRDLVEAAEVVPVKLIVETCLLTDDEKRRACALAVEAGVKMVKTSTGFGRAGATVEDVRLLRECVPAMMGVKASGGIRDATTALAMIDAGATRLGTSAGVAIMEGLHGLQDGAY